jgi:IstB-like ATP binding protein
MNVQHERIAELCAGLRLGAVAAQYSVLAQQAAEQHSSFTDFHETLLLAERESRRARARAMLARVAGFPAIKTLEQYDFAFATGAPRKQIMELASLAFVERGENVVFLGPFGGRQDAYRDRPRLSGDAKRLQDPLPHRRRSSADARGRAAPGPLSRSDAPRGQRLPAADCRRGRLSPAAEPRTGQSFLSGSGQAL